MMYITFAFTGALKTMTRETAENMVRDAGYNVVYNVMPKTNYLVTNDTTTHTAKLCKAKLYDTKIINEIEFKKILGEEVIAYAQRNS